MLKFQELGILIKIIQLRRIPQEQVVVEITGKEKLRHSCKKNILYYKEIRNDILVNSTMLQ
jgi:hypothetical protein